MSSALRIAVLSLGFALFGLTACEDDAAGSGGPDLGASCTENRHCELPLSCVDGHCQIECRHQRDCKGDEVCHESACYPYPSACQLDTQCAPFGEVCDRVRLRCVPPGTALCDEERAPCPVDARCVDGQCVPREGVPLDQGVPTADQGVEPTADQGVEPTTDQGVEPSDAQSGDAGPPADAQPVQDGEPVPDQSVPPDEDAGGCPPQGGGQYGDPCLRAADCASGFCVENKLRGHRVCTSLCDLESANPAAHCPGLDVCVPAQAGPLENPDCPPPLGAPQPGEVVGVCFANETGLPCDYEQPRPGECIGGACMQPVAPAHSPMPWIDVQAVCAASCVDDRVCPAGTRCQTVPGAAGKLCAPTLDWMAGCNGSIDRCGGACPSLSPEAEVGAARCLTIDGMPGGYCSCNCRTSADCHPGYACSPLGAEKVCIPFAGLACPQEEAAPQRCMNQGQCGVGELCFNGYCQHLQCFSLTCMIDDEDPRKNRCTTACAQQADCPAGFQCAEVEGAGRFCLAP